jgi:hypothetical protein
MKPYKVLTLLIALLVCSIANSAENKLNERYSGRVIDAAGAVPGFSATYVTITVDRYNTDDEIAAYAQALAEKGQDGLLKAIENKENGRIRIGDRLSYPLSAIRMFEKDGKRLIRALTDRPIPMIEAWRNNRSMDYPFGFIEILIDKTGKGQGTLIAAAKIEIKDRKLEMESYGREPFRLTNIKKK